MGVCLDYVCIQEEQTVGWGRLSFESLDNPVIHTMSCTFLESPAGRREG